jgi:hypothetical protein
VAFELAYFFTGTSRAVKKMSLILLISLLNTSLTMKGSLFENEIRSEIGDFAYLWPLSWEAPSGGILIM